MAVGAHNASDVLSGGNSDFDDGYANALERNAAFGPLRAKSTTPKKAVLVNEPLTFRQPPHNIEAEQALLGAILVNNEALDRVSGFLAPTHFFDPLHGKIFETLAALIHAGKTATPITVKTFFENVEPIDANMTVPQYLGRLAVNATTIINAAEYGRTIYDLAMRRSLIIIGEDMVNTAYDSAVDYTPRAQIEEAEERLFQVAELASARGTVSFADAAQRALEGAYEAHKLHGLGLKTGLIDLDYKIGGLRRSHLIVLAGRPAMGKTALAMNIAWHIARHRITDSDGVLKPAPVGIFSLEMSGDELASRITAAQAGVSQFKLLRGQTTEEDLRKLAKTTAALAKTPIFIDASGDVSIAQLASRARRMKRLHGIQLLIVDYIQLMGSDRSKRNDSRVQEITEITKGLKAIAKELDIPVLALSQLNRGVENREDKRPQLSDLRESGSIEQDADIVMFVFREEYYLERALPDDGDPKFADAFARLAAARGKAEVIIGKARHGPVGTTLLHFDGETTSFSNFARSDALQTRGRD